MPESFRKIVQRCNYENRISNEQTPFMVFNALVHLMIFLIKFSRIYESFMIKQTKLVFKNNLVSKFDKQKVCLNSKENFLSILTNKSWARKLNFNFKDINFTYRTVNKITKISANWIVRWIVRRSKGPPVNSLTRHLSPCEKFQTKKWSRLPRKCRRHVTQGP